MSISINDESMYTFFIAASQIASRSSGYPPWIITQVTLL